MARVQELKGFKSTLYLASFKGTSLSCSAKPDANAFPYV